MTEAALRGTARTLWRALAVYRFASLGYAVGLLIYNRGDYSRLGWAWAVFAAMTVRTVLTTVGYARPTARSAAADRRPADDRRAEAQHGRDPVPAGRARRRYAHAGSGRIVQNHVQNTRSKLPLHNRVELVRYAIEHGLAGE